MKTKVLVISLAVVLVLIELYLIASSVIDKNKETNQIQSFCSARCKYDPSSFLWEFSGDTFTKGFTTRDECFNYCSKAKQGFVYNFLENATASINRIFYKIFGK